MSLSAPGAHGHVGALRDGRRHRGGQRRLHGQGAHHPQLRGQPDVEDGERHREGRHGRRARRDVLLRLSSPVGAAIADAEGVGTILNDDVPPVVPGGHGRRRVGARGQRRVHGGQDARVHGPPVRPRPGGGVGALPDRQRHGHRPGRLHGQGAHHAQLRQGPDLQDGERHGEGRQGGRGERVPLLPAHEPRRGDPRRRLGHRNHPQR